MGFFDFEGLVGVAQTALAYAVLFCRKGKIAHPPIDVQDLLNPRVLLRAIREIAQVDGWLPVEHLPKSGYVSWLGIWQQGQGQPTIAIRSDVFSGLLQGAHLSNRVKHAQFALLAVVLHEVGHEVLRDPDKPRRFRTPTKGGLFADRESLKSEANAWLFSVFLCGLVFAEVVSAAPPDIIPEYLI